MNIYVCSYLVFYSKPLPCGGATDPLRGKGAQRNSTKTQQSGQNPGSGTQFENRECRLKTAEDSFAWRLRDRTAKKIIEIL